MLKQNDKVIFTAQGYANSETVGVVDNTTVFVPFLMVGEQAVVRINYAKKGVAYGDVVELLKTSPKRVSAPCPHFGKCGGCSLMHMPYQEQLLFKHAKVQNNLKKIGGLQVDLLPTVPSPLQFGYRNKLSLPVSGKRGNVKIGMYQKGSHVVTNCQECLLADQWATTLVALFRQYLNTNNIAPYNERDFSGEVRHLVARYVDGQLLVTVVSNGKFRHDLQTFANMLAKHFPKFGLYVNQNDGKNNVILGKTSHHVCGISHIQGTHMGVQFRLHPHSFFQINDGVKDLLYSKAKQLLNTSNTQVLVDLFSGIGVLTTALCSPNYDTIAVEIEPSAVADAEQIKTLNNSPRLTNLCGDANVLLPQIAEQNKGKTLSLVVDPPRKGLGATICQTILSVGFDNIVYISCDSATLARDLAMLCPTYKVEYIQPYDMFPNTDQVETLVWLSK